MADQQKVIYGLSNGGIFNDLIVVPYVYTHYKIRVFFPNVKYVKIRYNLVKNSLSDVIARLQGLMFSTSSDPT